MELTEKCIDRKEIFKGHVITLYHDKVELPDGGSAMREIVSHNGGACVAAMNDKGELAFVRQFRYAFGRVLLELPAGKLEPGEQPLEAIKRELKEEVGAEGYDWVDLGEMYPSVGYVNEIIYLYSCRIGSLGEQRLDKDEFLNIEFISLEEAARMVMSGEIKDAKTQLAVLKLLAIRK